MVKKEEAVTTYSPASFAFVPVSYIFSISFISVSTSIFGTSFLASIISSTIRSE